MANHKNEYDLMKDLLGKMKSYKKINESIVKEELNTTQLSDAELEDEQSKFKAAIPLGAVTFDAFIIKPENKVIEWSGVFQSERLAWNYSLDSSKGCYISADQTQLSDENLEIIQKLKAYYNEWAQYWSNEIS